MQVAVVFAREAWVPDTRGVHSPRMVFSTRLIETWTVEQQTVLYKNCSDLCRATRNYNATTASLRLVPSGQNA
jgi:hypothetical protein